MPNKTKNNQNIADKLGEVAMQGGLVLMAVAATLGMLETPDKATKLVVPNQPALALAVEAKDPGSTLRREREEVGPHYISYSVAQRTPSRAGKH